MQSVNNQSHLRSRTQYQRCPTLSPLPHVGTERIWLEITDLNYC
jgi:hypothetical protein